MARVSHFIEHIDIDFTSFPELERQIARVDEKPALITPSESAAKPKTTTTTTTTTTKARAGLIKVIRRLAFNCVTNYKHHFSNLSQNANIAAHHDGEDIEAGSKSPSSYGAPMTSAEELEQQSKQNNLTAIYGLRFDDESSAFTAYTAKKQPTTAITKVQATAEPRTPDAPTFWAQVCVTKGTKLEVIMTGYESEIENIEKNTNAELEFLAYLGVEFDIDIEA